MLPLFDGAAPADRTFEDFVGSFEWQGAATRRDEMLVRADVATDALVSVPTFTNEFWTSRQRAAHSLHEISYRACFKPQLPRLFIEQLTRPRDVVYDPFMGRGTTVLEAALAGRVPYGCDVNPLSVALVRPRLAPPTLDQVAGRLARIDLSRGGRLPARLRVFYHPETLREVCALRAYLIEKEQSGLLDDVDRWIRMVAVNRLTGHSAGFFSVYTLPPNQAVSVAAQRKINRDRRQTPPRRSVPALILAKTRSLMADLDPSDRERLAATHGRARLMTSDSGHTPAIDDASVDLVVTSPPFLDVVDYSGDNWLRCWFCGIDPSRVAITIARKPEDWQASMRRVLVELARVTRPGGYVAFEVGEVRGGRVKLEELVVPAGCDAGLTPQAVLINAQHFTKTANCWGVSNNRKGTNTNRIVVFRKR